MITTRITLIAVFVVVHPLPCVVTGGRKELELNESYWRSGATATALLALPLYTTT